MKRFGKIFMSKLTNLHRIGDEKIGRETRKIIRGAQGAARAARQEVVSKGKVLQSEAGVYLREQAVTTLLVVAAAGLLMNLMLAFYHPIASNRRPSKPLARS